MSPEAIVAGVITAAISYLVPFLLDRLLKREAKELSVGKVAHLPWGQWVFLQAVGGALGGAISGAMGAVVLGGSANWAAFGGCVGIMQWIVLRRLIPIGPWWVLGSALGWATYELVGGHLGWVTAGALAGALQWPSLRSRLPKSGLWIVINALAWLPAGLAGLGVGVAVASASNFAVGWVVGWAVVAGVGGLIVGIPLASLLSKTEVVSSA
jgi:hypothetical protein